MKRREAREKALQALFQIDVSDTERTEAMTNVMEDAQIDEFLEKLVYGTTDHLEEIDALIEKHLEKWSIDRLGNIDRAVLRLAVYEMKFEKDIPRNVVYNEAIEIAKTFGGEESGRFVNGVLTKVSQSF
ncbi:N utilization substance protein B [Lottiidibacillus patelloidae]|uniref:Transcription antitermination protein NusB n=1 Tax=Lottiidibacillus patelloidae TaxID=2670334 RepID=A0A263BV75_9BACI|nr:transcription antitermination factor NusB [Lottiidibacillus patelloidae]OZM57624.1 N utilization substance protein B [Lottiidibacillus patelloidae]